MLRNYAATLLRLSKLADSNNTFAFRLLPLLAATSESKNLIFSPYSVHAVLSMTLNGAQRETLQEMRQALGLRQMGRPTINAQHLALRNALEAPDSGVEMSTANSLWVGRGEVLNEIFVQNCLDYYAARAGKLEGDLQAILITINGWVAEKTRDRIPDLLSEGDLKPVPALALLNAVYFKGLWKRPFDAGLTAPGDFHTLSGECISVPMMSQSGCFGFAEVPEGQIVSLPYGVGEEEAIYCLDLFLPTPETTIAEVLPRVGASWGTWIDQLDEREVDLSVPRFCLENTFNLNGPLTEIGMGRAFSPEANFGGMAPNPEGASSLAISQVRQRALLEVNEEGSEAAAATVVLMVRGMMLRPRMIVDRPFLCAIRHRPSGLILFLAVVVDPVNG